MGVIINFVRGWGTNAPATPTHADAARRNILTLRMDAAIVMVDDDWLALFSAFGAHQVIKQA